MSAASLLDRALTTAADLAGRPSITDPDRRERAALVSLLIDCASFIAAASAETYTAEADRRIIIAADLINDFMNQTGTTP